MADLPEKVILDEVQRVPELFLALKAAVDRQRTAGRFILTGSANVLLVPNWQTRWPGASRFYDYIRWLNARSPVALRLSRSPLQFRNSRTGAMTVWALNSPNVSWLRVTQRR
ncbi:AAA family ATPase [Candidatus Amarolinea dominans]|uniref:AAA family ATPase n=1 Tax=Candidatus Amarolinea dominans TaxID=3140696 RepID=UPI0031CC7895